jgi:hypothetical protein
MREAMRLIAESLAGAIQMTVVNFGSGRGDETWQFHPPTRRSRYLDHYGQSYLRISGSGLSALGCELSAA